LPEEIRCEKIPDAVETGKTKCEEKILWEYHQGGLIKTEGFSKETMPPIFSVDVTM